ncbi:unnamed protein product [Lathyrus sativus]|nr:unnamed protein product [Lathyrus sativus]
MTLLDMGYVMANQYDIILVSLGYPSLTCFPMTTSHSPNVSIYYIGFVNKNYLVQVNMNEGFPLPPVTLDLKKYCTSDTTSWMIRFSVGLQNWQHLTPTVLKYVKL